MKILYLGFFLGLQSEVCPGMLEWINSRPGGGQYGRACGPRAPRRINPDVVDEHGSPRDGRVCRATAESAWKGATYRDVQDDEESVVQCISPRGSTHLSGVNLPELYAIQIPADLFGRDAPIIL